jgi:four helix bundle protein
VNREQGTGNNEQEAGNCEQKTQRTMDKEYKQKTDVLKQKMDELAYFVYRETKNFPKDEIYGITSQLRRVALSVVLNYIEGYARTGTKEYKNFLQISYGSLKETKYLIFFSMREEYMSNENYEKLAKLTDEIGAMLWTTIQRIKDLINK